MIRDARPDDYDAYAALFPHLGVDDPLPSRARFEDDLAPRVVIADDGDGAVGYALFEIMADTGYVRNIVTDPARRRRGVGAALMEAMRRRFVDAGLSRWCLNVKADNAPARALYRRCGLADAYRSWALRLPAEATLPAPPPALSLAPVPPDDDAAVEAAFALLPGQLASARAKPDRDVLALLDGGARRGVAVFAASLPGAFPFKVTAPALGPALAALLRPRVPAGAPFMLIAVEDDDPLAAALRARGAEVRFEIVHMRGPL